MEGRIRQLESPARERRDRRSARRGSRRPRQHRHRRLRGRRRIGGRALPRRAHRGTARRPRRGQPGVAARPGPVGARDGEWVTYEAPNGELRVQVLKAETVARCVPGHAGRMRCSPPLAPARIHDRSDVPDAGRSTCQPASDAARTARTGRGADDRPAARARRHRRHQLLPLLPGARRTVPGARLRPPRPRRRDPHPSPVPPRRLRRRCSGDGRRRRRRHVRPRRLLDGRRDRPAGVEAPPAAGSRGIVLCATATHFNGTRPRAGQLPRPRRPRGAGPPDAAGACAAPWPRATAATATPTGRSGHAIRPHDRTGGQSSKRAPPSGASAPTHGSAVSTSRPPSSSRCTTRWCRSRANANSPR